jgi:hypothetical protein
MNKNDQSENNTESTESGLSIIKLIIGAIIMVSVLLAVKFYPVILDIINRFLSKN